MKRKVQSTTIEITPQLIEIIVKVAQAFGGNYNKTKWWMITKNPCLGEISPIVSIAMGRGHKVLEFIKDAEAGNIA